MSGHSKWAQIHRQKGTADSKRGALFTKLGKTITVAARIGGGEPESNFKLRLAMDQAKAANMPKENIERAIKRGTGDADGGRIEEITYEGFGPGGTALMILCLTDNRNRTSSSIKHILAKAGGSLGTPNSVARMFEQKGVIRLKNISDELELELIDLGSQDIIKDEEGSTIYTNPADLKKIKEFLEAKGVKTEYAEVEQVAKEQKNLTAKQKEVAQKMLEELNSDEDVDDYYINADLGE